jgi:selenocysteine lyase/cysteine desulfurase
MGKAMEILKEVGFDAIEEHEQILLRKLIDGLLEYDTVTVYGDTEDISDRVGVVTFTFSDVNSFLLAKHLSEVGRVATRRGAFCAHPYVWRLMGISDEKARSFENCSDVNTAGMVRVSFGIYNNEDEVQQFLDLMPTVMTEAMEVQKNSTAVPEY